MGFIIAAVSALTFIYGLFGVRIIQPARIGAGLKCVFWALLSILYGAVPLAIIIRFKAPDSPAAIALSWIAYVAFGFFTLAFPLLLSRDVSLWFFRVSSWLVKAIRRSDPSGRDVPPDSPTRRGFLINATNLVILGTTGTLTGCGLVKARRIPEVLKVDVPLENLPREFDGFRILQITDLHVGMTIRRDYVEGVVSRGMAQQPDMIVMTGDLADGDSTHLRAETAPLARLRAPFGKFFVTGNHEYHSGVELWLTEVGRLGFVSLLNDHRILRRRGAGLVIAGVTDYSAGQIFPDHASEPAAALAGAPESMVKIMLAHQPKSVFRAEPAGADFLITGHTHGGQYIPWNYMVSLDQPYVYGLHTHGNARIYVSRGTGYWGPPIRIGAPSEITVLKLVRA